MTKVELVEKMAKDAGITKAAAGAALASFIDGVTKALKKKDGKVTLVGLAHFQNHVVKPERDVIPKQVKRLRSKQVMLLNSKLARN